jgi:2-aminoadipate transaminase
MNQLFASRAKKMQASEIREILKLTQQPDIISFAGGLPAPELFPIEQLKRVANRVLDEMGESALQYNPTEGYDPLREKIANRMSLTGTTLTKENILVTSGSQQGLDFSGKIFLDTNDVVLCESPSYLGAINAFKAYECKFHEIKTDEDGMDMADLEYALKVLDRVKIIYVIPDFQNPSGRTWSKKRREMLVELANKYDKIIIEDNPYGELRYDGEMIPSVKSMDTEGRVVYLGTFSKTFCPGLRIGWVAADDLVLNKYIMVKQGADLQTNSMSQRELSLFLDDYDFNEHIDKLIKLYRGRRDTMIHAMDIHFPKTVKYDVPSGGLFIWAETPVGTDTKELMIEAVKNKVAFVPGESFFPNGGVKHTMRLNFSNMNDEKIEEGIKRLGAILTSAIK